MNFLIVKTSSLGDIIQTLPILSILKKHYPDANIDWVAEKSFCEILHSHPAIRRVIPVEVRKWKKSLLKSRSAISQSIRSIRKEKYDFLFDLQGNIKSGLITRFARAKEKVGYAFSSAPEWPNGLFLTSRYQVHLSAPISTQYQSLLLSHLNLPKGEGGEAIQLNITKDEKAWIDEQLVSKEKPYFMVCPGSHWENKKLAQETWVEFLKRLEKKYSPTFFFIWGTEKEKREVEALNSHFPSSHIIPRMTLPVWQRMMDRMDMVITVDSGALHLAATTSTPTFSIFGPSSSQVYKPGAPHHHAFQSPCPYGKTFTKRCLVLRTCQTGACMKNISPQALVDKFNLR